MKDTLVAGLEHTLRYRIPEDKTVPHLYPESPEFVEMPDVFATGFMVGLVEWACIALIKPHLDWPAEQSLGVHVDLSHTAATPPGLEVTVQSVLESVDGRRLRFRIEARDERDVISQGTHDRFVIDVARFQAGVDKKGAEVAGD
jgi:fluoroacetyl-CoA thioesterase